jgi:hypothetical protein
MDWYWRKRCDEKFEFECEFECEGIEKAKFEFECKGTEYQFLKHKLKLQLRPFLDFLTLTQKLTLTLLFVVRFKNM